VWPNAQQAWTSISSTLFSILIYQLLVIRQRRFGNTLGSWGVHGFSRTSIARRGFALFSGEGPRQPESSTLLERFEDLVLSTIIGTQLAQRQPLGIFAALSLLRVFRHSVQHRAPASLFASGIP